MKRQTPTVQQTTITTLFPAVVMSALHKHTAAGCIAAAVLLMSSGCGRRTDFVIDQQFFGKTAESLRALASSRDISVVAMDNPNGISTICVIDKSTNDTRRIAASADVSSLALSENGQLLAVGYPGRLELRDVSSLDQIEAFDFPGDCVHSASFAGTDTIVCGMQTGDVIAVDTNTHGKRPLATHKDACTCVATSGQHGGIVLSGGWDKNIILSDLKLTRPPRVLAHMDAYVQCVAVSPDGQFMAAGTYGGKVVAWETTSSKKTFESESLGEPVHTLAFSGTGELLLAGGGTVGLLSGDGFIVTIDTSSWRQSGRIHVCNRPIIAIQGYDSNNGVILCSRDRGVVVGRIVNRR